VVAAGGGTRHASHGATSTRRALSTIPAAARCATHPDPLASQSIESAPTVSMPAIWTTAINGTATKFKTMPANVTREKVTLTTGKRAISTAADVATDVRSHGVNTARRDAFCTTG